MLAPTDLLVTGLSIDVVGAILLARGLLLDARHIQRLGTYDGMGHGTVVDRVHSRVDAEFGLRFLALGFTLQALGYGLQLSGVAEASGPDALLTGLALALFVAAAAFATWLWQRDRRFRRLLVDVALSRPGSGKPGDEAKAGWTNARTNLLVDLGRASGFDVQTDDALDSGVDRYVMRVFGVEVPRYLPPPKTG